MPNHSRILLLGVLSAAIWVGPPAVAQSVEVDLAELSAEDGDLLRVSGSVGEGGRNGVPVAGGFDVDGDGNPDFAFSSMMADPLGRNGAGEIYLVFGDGTTTGSWDSVGFSSDILKFAGDVTSEAAGSELWMDDVTGDGLGDLLIARQNFTPESGREGAGALTIVVGGAELRSEAELLQYVDLRAPPPSLTMTTVVGAARQDRLGIWMRTGDVTGDGIADIVVGADQVSDVVLHGGAVYVIRGGAHLAANQVVDLEGFGDTALPGHLARVRPPSGGSHTHFGATAQIADLDGNGRAEVLAASALNRSGAAIQPSGLPPGGTPNHASGGTTDGTLYIAWDDNFSEPWTPAPDFSMDGAPATVTMLDGAACHRSFGEEILGGLDYDDDGRPDLFVGDIVGNCGPVSQTNAGAGVVFYSAEDLAGVVADLQTDPELARSEFYGPSTGAISSDTALHGDFNGDGIADLAIGSPHGRPSNRTNAGFIHVFFGRSGGWPAEIDLAALPSSEETDVTEISGANGTSGGDTGDTLCYSAAAGDIDLDGRVDLITNEMLGNGLLPAAEDSGNLIILSGARVSPVPEPGAFLLGCAALLGLGFRALQSDRSRALSCSS